MRILPTVLMALLGESLAPSLSGYANELRQQAMHSDTGETSGPATWLRDGDRILSLGRQTADLGYGGGVLLFELGPDQTLKEVARARICIDLPGEGDLCFRLVNYLAVGACIIGPPPRNVLHAPLTDRVHVAYTKPDLSDLVDVCSYYLAHDEAREEMARRSRTFFDECLHKDNLTAYYLRCCLDRLRN